MFNGVAWWGNQVKAGICQNCQRAAPVYEGFNGGQPMGIERCYPCIRLWREKEGEKVRDGGTSPAFVRKLK